MIYLTPNQAAARLGVHPDTVRLWCQKGLLPAEAIGEGRQKRWLIHRDELESFTPPKRGRPPKDD